MIRHTNKKIKKGYTDRFLAKKETQKTDALSTPYRHIVTIIKSKVDILESYIELGTCVIWVDRKDIYRAVKTIKSVGYDILSEMSTIDMSEKNQKLEIFYQFLGLNDDFKDSRRLRLKSKIDTQESVDSIVPLFKNAIWSQREIYDMFGIKFNQSDMRRLLMPDDWIGHPLLKSYPLAGDENASWYEVDKIFGEEYRERIGKEQRDSAKIDLEDEINFKRISPDTQKTYKDENAFLITKFNKTEVIERK